MDVCVELIAGDVWEAKYDRTGFLSVKVDSFDWLFLGKRPISLPTV